MICFKVGSGVELHLEQRKKLQFRGMRCLVLLSSTQKIDSEEKKELQL